MQTAGIYRLIINKPGSLSYSGVSTPWPFASRQAAVAKKKTAP